MNIFDDIRRADRLRTECDHIWVLRNDKKSIYCYDCKLEKTIDQGTPIDGGG